MSEGKVTIHDVAKAANVSAGTVSRYINRIGVCRGNTSERIEKAIQELHYVPDRSARALKSKRNNLLCMAYPESDNPFFFKMVSTVEAAVKDAGYELMVYHTHGRIDEELRILALTQEGIMDGLFMVNFNYTPGHFEAFKKTKCPLVLSSLCISPYGGRDEDTYDYVGIDVRNALYMSTMSLLEMGHKKIAYVGGDKSLCVFSERYEGFCQALETKALRPQGKYCFFGAYDQQAGYDAGVKIAQMKDRPTAVCAVSDIMAIGVMMAFKDYHVRIPEDIALIGLDDITFDCAFSPQLSSVMMRQDDLGKCAVEMLLARLQGDDSEPKKIIYQPKLVVRESSMFRI